MALTKLEILGLRGFGTKQGIHFACPNGSPGSGLTVIVGANNSGKSTIVEALRALTQPSQSPSFTQGRRNLKAGDQISLLLKDSDGGVTELRSVRPGTSETQSILHSQHVNMTNILVLPSRRTFSPYFSRSETNRQAFMTQMGFPPIRTSSVEPFSYRLFSAFKRREEFNQVLAKVLDPVPTWSIDQHDTGQYFLKFTVGDAAHSSEGLGEGLVSLFFIVDALYDSTEGNTIVIDEPELSLHPTFQRKLAKLLTEYAATRQIILATHSPYFVNLAALENGATVARTHLSNGQSQISQLNDPTAKAIASLLTDVNNPHVFGLNAQEVFFLEDQVILVEGQDDVIFYQRIADNLNLPLLGNFFGWGVGGADKMKLIAQVLADLGFKAVVGILDRNKAGLIPSLQAAFPDFRFFSIPSDDVRTKKASKGRPVVEGLLDDTNTNVRPEHVPATQRLFQQVNEFLKDKS